MASSEYRNLPSVDTLLSNPSIEKLVNCYSHQAVVWLTRSQLGQARKAVASGRPSPTTESLVESILQQAQALWRPHPLPVINASGVIIHTNLGRAPLSQEAVQAVTKAAASYSNLEMDLEEGERGGRDKVLESLICQLTGAEAAFAVNNNASAVLLGLTGLAHGKEVIVSRGEAIEIGGGFRIPDVLTQSGARLIEVGTTNRTRISDYASAVTPETSALLKVHPSNFKVIGFTESPSLKEMADLAQRQKLMVFHDVGSGCLLDTTQFGLAAEPTPQASIADGADLVFFSGDKLLGGPQAGIIAGRRDLISSLKKHPLARVTRMDKLTMAALTATLLHYVKQEALEKIPVWRMISMPLPEIESRALSWLEQVGKVGSIRDGSSTIGGGSLPGETLPTKLLALSPNGPSSPQTLVRKLRLANPPVVARIDQDLLLLDPRTVLPEQDNALVSSLQTALSIG